METELFLSGIQTINQRGERDVDKFLHPLDYLGTEPVKPKPKKPKRTEPEEEYVQLSLF